MGSPLRAEQIRLAERGARYSTMQAAALAPGRWGTRACPAGRFS
ncbi:hypothetical protein AB4156_25190 [Cupriavidus sp. 2MCAB6]